jgi:hypothetical protein
LNNAGQFRANGTIGPSKYITPDTTADNMVLQATAGQAPIGISQIGMKRAPGLPGSDVTIAAQVGDVVMVYALGDVTELVLGTGGCTRGDFLKSDANGAGVTATVVGTDEVGARALQSGTAGQLVLVQILSRKL